MDILAACFVIKIENFPPFLRINIKKTCQKLILIKILKGFCFYVKMDEYWYFSKYHDREYLIFDTTFVFHSKSCLENLYPTCTSDQINFPQTLKSE